MTFYKILFPEGISKAAFSSLVIISLPSKQPTSDDPDLSEMLGSCFPGGALESAFKKLCRRMS